MAEAPGWRYEFGKAEAAYARVLRPRRSECRSAARSHVVIAHSVNLEIEQTDITPYKDLFFGKRTIGVSSVSVSVSVCVTSDVVSPSELHRHRQQRPFRRYLGLASQGH